MLGKIIGVYLGRPFEGWGHDALVERFGEIRHYVHDSFGVPLVVSDDDISGTFTFLRAFSDHGLDPHLTPAQIGETWLNYLIEERTILWWGGMGTSTEHTAFLRLKHGIAAPESGSTALNGQTVAEQIGAQIFIDGWAMICPGEPDRAADFARRAASVSHDGEAIFGAQVVAAIEAQAFVESDIDRLIDTGLAQIPKDSTIARLISDIREWHASGMDWRAGFRKIEEHYGYAKFGGGCHMVPNHALIIHALLHGRGDFNESMCIVNTCGWDTDCNSGNVGCILGIRNGLAAFDKQDWRGPVADRMYLPTADGGRCITDAATEALHIVNVRRAMAGLEEQRPKNGARFHFELPGSVQGFARADAGVLRNLGGCLEVEGPGRIATPTFLHPFARRGGGYSLMASPTLHPGQKVKAVVTSATDAEVALYVSRYDGNDQLEVLCQPGQRIEANTEKEVSWEIPDVGGFPIAEVGIQTDAAARLLSLTWDGAPDTILRKPDAGSAWRDAWVNGVSEFATWGDPFRLIQNEGTGLLMQGSRDWRDYEASANLTLHLVERAGIAIHVQGMRRWVALLLCRDGFARLVKAKDGEQELAKVPFAWSFDESYELALRSEGNRYAASIDGTTVLEGEDTGDPLEGGAVAFILTEGRIGAQSMRIRP